MGKIRKNRNKPNNLNYIIFIAPFTVICILVSFMVIQYVGERFGFSPIITLQGNCLGCMGSESVIMFILILGISIFIGLIFSYIIINKYKNR